MTRRGRKARRGDKSGDARGGARSTTPAAAPAEAPRKRRLAPLLLCLASPLLLLFAFAPYDVWPLGYVGLVPLVVGLALAPSRRWALLSAWLAGLAFWAAMVHWLTWITLPGYVAGVLYVSLYWLIAGALVWAALRRGQPMWIVLPLVWVTLEFLRGNAQEFYLGPSFPWFALAHSQYRQTVLIQIADVTGYHGLSLLVAMINGLIADRVLSVLRRRPGQGEPGAAESAPALTAPARPGLCLAVGTACTALATAGTIGYGMWQLSRDTRAEGPVIGVVQHAYPVSLGGDNASQDETLEAHLVSSRAFLGAQPGPDLVVWPETIMPNSLNREMLDLDIDSLRGDALRSLAAKYVSTKAWEDQYDEQVLRRFLRRELLFEGEPGDRGWSRRQQARRILGLAESLGCPILAGGATIHRNPDPLFREDHWLIRNSALWFEPNEPNAPIYSKQHLVPFSELVPFKHSWLGFHLLLRSFVPGMMDQLDPGADSTVFELRRPGGTWRIVSPICYEGTIGPLCRQMVYADGAKRADIMVNLSNDGWFVCPWTGSKYGSTEQSQHLSHYVFRAVENRVPVVRAVNTGISASIDSNGRIVAEIENGGRNTMVSGTMMLDGRRGGGVEYLPGHGPKVLVDKRISWYSRVGDLFGTAIAVLTGLWAVGMLAFARRR